MCYCNFQNLRRIYDLFLRFYYFVHHKVFLSYSLFCVRVYCANVIFSVQVATTWKMISFMISTDVRDELNNLY